MLSLNNLAPFCILRCLTLPVPQGRASLQSGLSAGFPALITLHATSLDASGREELEGS